MLKRRSPPACIISNQSTRYISVPRAFDPAQVEDRLRRPAEALEQPGREPLGLGVVAAHEHGVAARGPAGWTITSLFIVFSVFTTRASGTRAGSARPGCRCCRRSASGGRPREVERVRDVDQHLAGQVLAPAAAAPRATPPAGAVQDQLGRTRPHRRTCRAPRSARPPAPTRRLPRCRPCATPTSPHNPVRRAGRRSHSRPCPSQNTVPHPHASFEVGSNLYPTP